MRRLPDDDALTNIVLTDYRKCARRRDYEFNLDREVFKRMIFDDCFYCGRPPSNQIAGRNGTRFRKHNGIDRVDTSRNYDSDNVVTACRWCNEAKRAKTFEEFIGWVEGLSERMEKIRARSN